MKLAKVADKPKQKVWRRFWLGMPMGLKKVSNVDCSDGFCRTATITGDADTFFSIPCRVKVQGKTVAGSLYYDSLTERYSFGAYTYRKNGHLLP